MKVAGVERDLPLCPIGENLYIGAFILFGDVELTEKCAEALYAKAPEHDVMITAESKGIPLDTKEHIRNMPESYYIVSCENYLVSQKFYDMLKLFCSEVQRAVVSLLEVLPGTQFAGENGLWDYLISL
jgi:hypothetical protein